MLVVIDTALRDFFRRFTWAERSLPVVYAGPERARAEMRKMLAGRPEISEKELDQIAIPYPWCSIYREPTIPMPERFSPAVLRNFNMDAEAGTAMFMRAPKEVNMPVQADFWFSGQFQRDSIEAQLTMEFWSGKVAIPIDWGDPKWYLPPYNVSAHAKIMGQTKCVLVYESFTDNSDLETDNKERIIRLTFTGFVQASLPHVPVTSKIAKRFEIEVGVGTEDDFDPEVILNVPLTEE
jgi:hypothetical protein